MINQFLYQYQITTISHYRLLLIVNQYELIINHTNQYVLINNTPTMNSSHSLLSLP